MKSPWINNRPDTYISLKYIQYVFDVTGMVSENVLPSLGQYTFPRITIGRCVLDNMYMVC